MEENFNIYACGGAGVNIIKNLNKLPAKKVFIDTSYSNLKSVDKNSIYVVEDMDGAGKHRATTYEVFKDYVNDIFVKFKPSEKLNVVISSLSGGSGSIIAPFITRELIKQNKNVIVVAIETRNSVIEMENSVKTLKTYKSISDQLEKSIAICHIDEESRTEADRQAYMILNLLSILVDKNATEEFDITDLSNFINFNKVTDNAPNVGILTVNPNINITPRKNTHIVSTILLTKTKEEKLEPVIPEYLATCIVTDESFKESLRIDNFLGLLSEQIEDLENSIKNFKENKSLNRIKNVEVKGNEDGIVL